MIRYFSEKFPFEQKTSGSSGFDLYNCGGPWTLEPGERHVFSCGLYLEMPPGVEAQVRSRSGRVRDHGIALFLGTVDSDYRGEISVTLFNFGQERYMVEQGDRIAQLVFCPYYPQAASLNLPYDVELVPVASVDKLSKTPRGAGGFGSTGR
jgi:dUTP pyrophosphatase